MRNLNSAIILFKYYCQYCIQNTSSLHVNVLIEALHNGCLGTVAYWLSQVALDTQMYCLPFIAERLETGAHL